MERSVNVVFLTVAGQEIGFGHLFRSSALMEALQERGAACRLIVAPTGSPDTIRQRIDVIPNVFAPWSSEVDALATIISGAEIVVIDAYEIEPTVWKVLVETVSRLVVFDDRGGPLPPRGIVINGNPGATTLNYPVGGDVSYLLGPRYQVLRSPFWRRCPDAIDPGSTVSDQIRIGVMAGGTDHRRITETVVQTILRTVPAETVVYPIGSAGGGYTDSRVHPTGVLNAEGIHALFCKLDVLVTAAGQTVAEAAACCLPAIIFQTADNQAISMTGWPQTGGAISVGSIDDTDWAERLAAGLRKVIRRDQRSRRRVADRLLEEKMWG